MWDVRIARVGTVRENKPAPIEACASGESTLASKNLVQRLVPDDARNLELVQKHMKYTQFADLATATEKELRDAPAISVSEIEPKIVKHCASTAAARAALTQKY
jgi:hypothetical protein